MSKDLTKEYKEAVANDLPDRWGRIEAALDAEENKTQETQSEIKPVVNIKSEPVVIENVTKNKKRKRIPGWVFVALPSAAILVVAIIPLTFLGLNSGTKNYSAMAADCEPAAPDYDCVDAAAVPSENANCFEIAEEESEDSLNADVYENFNFKGIDDFSKESFEQYTAGSGEDGMYLYLNNRMKTLLEKDWQDIPSVADNGNAGKSDGILPNAEGEQADRFSIVNPNVKVRIESVSEENGEITAKITIIKNVGEYSKVFEDFIPYSEGDTVEVECVENAEMFKEGNEYSVYILWDNEEEFSKPIILTVEP